jgi:hypothetical protein
MLEADMPKLDLTIPAQVLSDESKAEREKSEAPA